MDISVSDLFKIIGELYVQNSVLRAQAAERPAEIEHRPLSDVDVARMMKVADEA